MEQYITIKQVLDDLLEHPLLKELSLERVINHTIHFFKIVGMPKLHTNVVEVFKVKDYKVKLPCNFFSLKGVRYNDSKEVILPSTSIYDDKAGSTYKLQGGTLIFSFRTGEVEVSYSSLAVDKEGLPLIPNDSLFIEALELYIKKKRFGTLVEVGLMHPNIYSGVCQEYAWAVGKVQSSLIMPSTDEMENISNMWKSMLEVNHHKLGFSTLGDRIDITNK